jgi:hypothetical protein
VKFIFLDVDFDEIRSFARLEAFIKCDYFNWDSAAGTAFDRVSPVIEI